MDKSIINNIQTKIIKNMKKERMNNMNVQMVNAVSGSIMSPMVDKLCKKVSEEDVRNLYNSLEFMSESELTQEAFSLLHIIIKASGVRLPEEYRCIVDNAKLRADFVNEALADIEDILYDFK